MFNNFFENIYKRSLELLEKQDYYEAIKFLKFLLSNNYRDDDCLFLIGRSYYNLGNLDLSIQFYKKYIRINPNNHEVLDTLARIYAHQKDLKSSKFFIEKALKLDPKNAKSIALLGSLYYDLGYVNTNLKDVIKSIELLEKSLLLDSSNPVTYWSLGLSCSIMGQYQDAEVNFHKALSLDPEFIQAKLDLSLIYLKQGNFKLGWKNYEIRKEKSKDQHLFISEKLWNGKKITSKKNILVYAEQGFGDMIQFSRYLIFLEKYFYQVIFLLPIDLYELFKSSFKFNIKLIPYKDNREKFLNLPNFDLYIPLMSLPYLFETTENSIPCSDSYITSPPEKNKFWNEKIQKEKFNIGIVFSGGGKTQTNLTRSLSFKNFSRCLTRFKDIEFHSLQNSYLEEDYNDLKAFGLVRDHSNFLIDFSDTAGLLDKMDLVISVDTSVAHLAGSMGKKVWILIEYLNDFRWLLDRSDSPWYSTAKLYRQKTFGDWTEVLSNIKNDITLNI